MPNDDRTAALIGRIYDAAADANVWPEVLKALAGDLGGMASVLITSEPKTGEGRMLAAAGLDPDYVASYAARYAAVDPWTERYAALPPGTVVSTDTLVPPGELAATEFYADWLRPQGIARSLGAVVSREGGSMIRLGVPRSEKQGPYDGAEIARLRVFAPHFRRALRFQRRISGITAERDAAAAALDRLSFGVVLLDDRGRVTMMNAAARAILDAGDALAVRDSRLSASRTADDAVIAGLIAAAAAPGKDSSAAGAVSLTRKSGLRPYSLFVAPLSPTPVERAPGRPVAALFIGDPECRPGMPQDTLMRLFGLTPAEARLATLLTSGMDLDAAARRLAIAKGTARHHLGEVLRKTGVHRQVELVALLLTSPAAFAAVARGSSEE